MKKWIIKNPDSKCSEKIAVEADISKLCADVLVARNFRSAGEAAEKFFSEELFDPFLLKDMREAVDVINQAIENADRICIYGDYDCDGITSTVMLYSYLDCMGADVMYRIPERHEGYGLNPDVVEEIAQQGAKLIITVDNGISAIDEAELIYRHGMKLVITDHHQPGMELPRAEAVVNPHRTDCPSIFKNLCGAGVVLKLIAALEEGDYETAVNEYGELAAIATIADIVELGNENRYIVKQGLQLIENSERCGINALIKKSGIKLPVTSTAISFGIAPRINASGRFGSPTLAARLLLTDDEQEAEMLCDELERLNEERKKTENYIIDSIGEKINSNPDIKCQRVIVLSGENWHHGVIGIVASRIQEMFDKPCFIISIEGDTARGSARSFGNFSVYKVLDYCSSVLIKYGGHVGAGGFSLKTSDIPEFERLIQEYAQKNFSVMPVPEIIADKHITPSEITTDNIECLNILQPYGEGNRQPVFAILDAEIIQIFSLSGGLHTKLKVKYGDVFLELLIFRLAPHNLFLNLGDRADFLVTLDTQVYEGRKSISIITKDYRKSGLTQDKFFAAKNAYEMYRRREALPGAYYKKMCPDRNELIPVYNALTRGRHNTETLYMTVASDEMNYCKLCLCVDIFNELGLARINHFSQGVQPVINPSKKNIDNSRILQNLRSKI